MSTVALGPGARLGAMGPYQVCGQRIYANPEHLPRSLTLHYSPDAPSLVRVAFDYGGEVDGSGEGATVTPFDLSGARILVRTTGHGTRVESIDVSATHGSSILADGVLRRAVVELSQKLAAERGCLALDVAVGVFVAMSLLEPFVDRLVAELRLAAG